LQEANDQANRHQIDLQLMEKRVAIQDVEIEEAREKEQELQLDNKKKKCMLDAFCGNRVPECSFITDDAGKVHLQLVLTTDPFSESITDTDKDDDCYVLYEENGYQQAAYQETIIEDSLIVYESSKENCDSVEFSQNITTYIEELLEEKEEESDNVSENVNVADVTVNDISSNISTCETPTDSVENNILSHINLPLEQEMDQQETTSKSRDPQKIQRVWKGVTRKRVEQFPCPICSKFN
jgi:hypothetical protein